jgi:glycosyltransferase involved in cell wall biosynthesis
MMAVRQSHMKTLSVVIPAYNEENTLETVVQSVLEHAPADIRKEVVIVDDGSTDGTRKLLERLATNPDCRIILHSHNRGKGAALRTGFAHASGDFILVQDADLEYDPRDYTRLLEPLLSGRADMVYGSRFISNEPTRVLYFHHYAGNRLITQLSNLCTNLNLSDVETCYKAFTRETLRQIAPRLSAERFGIEIELTARAAQTRPRLRIYEVGISYHGRTYTEGKKIGWKDGFAALWHTLRYNFWKK